MPAKELPFCTMKVFVMYWGNEFLASVFTCMCTYSSSASLICSSASEKLMACSAVETGRKKKSLVIGNKCRYFIAQHKSNWGLIDGACQKIISLFLARNFLQPQNTYSKERGKISAFLIASPYRPWVAVWVIDWLNETGLLSWLLTDWHWLTHWLTETGLLS